MLSQKSNHPLTCKALRTRITGGPTGTEAAHCSLGMRARLSLSLRGLGQSITQLGCYRSAPGVLG